MKFNWFQPKQVIPSMDYFERLEKEIETLRAEVKKLDARTQLREEGLRKVLSPVPAVHPTQRKQTHKKHIFLSLDDVNNIESSLLAGWTKKQIMTKYGISYNTVIRIEEGTHPKCRKPIAK